MAAEDPGGAAPSARAFWSGTLSFGLVSVPVELLPAQRRTRPSLRLLSPEGHPLRRRYVCPADGREVGPEHIVRGYELESGEYVKVSEEELEALAPEKSRDIDLRLFVDAAELDPTFFDRAYFLTPGGQSTKAYRLLAAAMEKAGRAGIATFVMRGKEYLVAILAEGGILRAETLRFADEVRSFEDAGLGEEPDGAPKQQVDRWRAALRQLKAKELDPDALRDEAAARLEELAEEKRRSGRDLVASPDAPVDDEDDDGDGPVDLMEVLKRSLSGGGRAGGAGGAGAGRRGSAARHGSVLASQTREELYERAKALEIQGRSAMTKDELIAAIRRRMGGG